MKAMKSAIARSQPDRMAVETARSKFASVKDTLATRRKRRDPSISPTARRIRLGATFRALAR
jgi:hypothetical protein